MSARQHLAKLVAVQPRQLQPGHAVVTLELAEKSKGRVLEVEVVGSHRQDHQDMFPAQMSHQEGDEIASVLVRPLEVLDDEGDVRRSAEAFDDSEDRFEQSPLGTPIELRTAGDLDRTLRKLGQQAGQPAPAWTQKSRQASRLDRPGQGAERLHEGHERDAATAELQTRPGKHRGAKVGRIGGKTLEQSGLADPCLATEDNRPAVAGDRAVQGGVQARKLDRPADELGRVGRVLHCSRIIRSRSGGAGLNHQATELASGPAQQRAGGGVGSAHRPGNLGAPIALCRQDQRVAIRRPKLRQRRAKRAVGLGLDRQQLRRGPWSPGVRAHRSDAWPRRSGGLGSWPGSGRPDGATPRCHRGRGRRELR